MRGPQSERKLLGRESVLERAEDRLRKRGYGKIMRGYFRGHSGKVSDGEEDRLDQRKLIKVQCRPDSLMAPLLEQFTKLYVSALPT